MKISIQGNEIDTQDIIYVTDIEEVSNVFNGNHTFTIKFQVLLYFKKSVDVCITFKWACSVNIFFNYDTKIYYNTLEELKDATNFDKEYMKLERLRDKVIEYWNTDKSTIPKLELE